MSQPEIVGRGVALEYLDDGKVLIEIDPAMVGVRSKKGEGPNMVFATTEGVEKCINANGVRFSLSLNAFKPAA